ncbi:Nickel transporter NicT [Nocardia stercoris]|uniref:Nickel/cobalt efflux system n=1 Tax=Nocardia stercoris TaxID=2483361 RepID=A0A3M2KUJ6_9NOCA|nr:HoxN/HupN/NixA family nickel/cobalt transporter [Nocardia stercoris]RMI29327.1 HoxN/HupN/NixA family nickel/cobalt transporter [Nocardia stercoris]
MSSTGARFFRDVLGTWTRRDWIAAAGLLGFVAVAHVVAFGLLFAVVAPHRYQLGTSVFGVGLGLTAYTFGLRHAFDADHIAAIDNTTRKLMTDGKRPKSVGFWFALGHSTIVFVLAGLVIAGAQAVGTLTDDQSPARHMLGTISTISSGTFLYLIAAFNIVALAGIWKVFRETRQGNYNATELETALDSRGLFARLLRPLMSMVSRPVQVYPMGVLFGLGFDTATEVALLAMAGSGSAAGLPWYAILLLPLLFSCGMTMMDTMDGLFMNVAYDWAFSNPVRKIFYNLTITGLSIAVAFLIGSIELIGVLHKNFDLDDPITNWISGIDLNNVGVAIVGLFVAAWVAAVAYWKLARVEQRWTPAPAVED